MKIQELIEELSKLPPDSHLELGKIISIDEPGDEAYTVRLDFPIIGLASNEETKEVILLVQHDKTLSHFGTYTKLGE